MCSFTFTSFRVKCPTQSALAVIEPDAEQVQTSTASNFSVFYPDTGDSGLDSPFSCTLCNHLNLCKVSVKCYYPLVVLYMHFIHKVQGNRELVPGSPVFEWRQALCCFSTINDIGFGNMASQTWHYQD